MNPRGEPYYHGSARWPSDARPFLPVAGTFSSGNAVGRGQARNNRHFQQGPGPAVQYVSPQQLFQPPGLLVGTDLPEPQIPFTASTSFQVSLDGAFVTSGPLVHEGFIPAPGREDEDESYPAYPRDYQDTPFYNPDLQTSSEDDSEEDRMMLLEAAEKNDLEEDKDYSMSEEELEDDPEELLLDEDFDDEEEPAPKRGRRKSNAPRGGRRGRASAGAKGGLRNATSSRGRHTGARGRPKGRRGPRATADPGPQFKELQRLANQAYLKKDFTAAMHYAQEAVKLNPEIFSAHNTLSEIYAAMDNELDSVRALIVGGPTKRDKGLWWLIIDRVEKIDQQKYPNFTDEVKTDIYRNCLKSILLLDSNDYLARSRKLEIEARLGNISACVKLCQKMLKIRPHEYDILKQMAILGTSTPKQTRFHLSKIIQCYDSSISHFVAHDDPTSSSLDWSLLNIYLDLLDRAGNYDHALSRLKKLCRWKQNREHETFWDDQEDDREFDLDDAPRRIAVDEFMRTSRSGKYGRALPIEIRIKMGLFRLQQSPSNFTEAMHHLEMLEPEDDGRDALLWDYPDLFRLAADALHRTGHDEDALRFYEPLFRHMRNQLNLKNFLGLYTCYKNLEQSQNASEIVNILQEWKSAALDEVTILAKFFEDIEMPEEAMQRAELVFRNRGAWRLRKVGFKGYEQLVKYFHHVRKQARGRHGVRKARVKKYMKKLQAATGVEQDSENEASTLERPSLGPLGERPVDGLFRTKERLLAAKPQTFLPIESETLEGTNVPIDAIDHKIFRKKLENLAIDCADELVVAREQHREISASFGRLDELSDAADTGDEAATSEFLSIARELIEEFSTFDLFYSDRRQEFKGYFRRIGSGDIWKDAALMALAVEANRIEDGEKERELKEKPEVVPPDFFGVHFDKWVDAFGRYALLLARRGDKDRCFSALDVALQSNIVYRSSDYTGQLELCRLACALAVGDSVQASSAIRWLMKQYPFGTDLFRLYSAANRLCPVALGFSNGPALKAFMRYIKTIDYVMVNPEQREWFNFRGDDRTQWMQQAITSEMVKYVKGHDPALFALYGHVLTGGGSYVGALNYYFRAFAITPDDPALNLAIGTAYIQHAMKRLSENRQFQIQQGLSFIYRYYELRTKDCMLVHQAEAEFNLGRVWHALGLPNQALRAYERCIALGKQIKEEAKDEYSGGRWRAEEFSAEAAFAMQTIYVLSGDFEAAHRVTREALVME